MRIIPAIDLKSGCCVRLLKGDFDQQTLYSSNPTKIADQFSALQVSDLHIVDLDGAQSGEQKNRRIVQDIAKNNGLEIQIGGGIRSAEDIERWLKFGVARCVVGSVAIDNVTEVCAWAQAVGTDRIVLALDVKLDSNGTPYLTTHGWTRDTQMSLWQCLDNYAAADIRQVLCTDVGRDGAMMGPNVGLYREILKRYPNLELQASGGIRHIGDLEQLRSMGVPAAITGRALLDGKITAEEISSFRQNA